MEYHRNTLVTGYTFAIRHVSAWLDYYKNKEDIKLVIPPRWVGRGGFVRFETPDLRGVDISQRWAFGMKRYFMGLMFFKGFMPGVILDFWKERPKLVYNASEPNLAYTLYTAILSKLFGAKHIFFSWENIDLGKKYNLIKSAIFKTIIYLCAKLSDGAIAGNKKAAQILSGYKGLRVEVIPLTGVDTKRFSPINPSENRWRIVPGADITFMFAGGLDKRKGLEFLLPAFARLSHEYGGTHLLIAGAGPMKEFITQFVDENDLSNQVTLLPWINNSELARYYNAADVFLYPSIPYKGWEEQFGYAMAEAASCAKPVIATATGSIDEVVIDGKTGILVRPGDVEDLYRAMKTLATNATLRTQYGSDARDHIVNNFSLERIAEKHFKFLSDTAHEKI